MNQRRGLFERLPTGLLPILREMARVVLRRPVAGETARATIARELLEEAGASVLSTGRLVGVYTAPERDLRMHALTGAPPYWE